MHALGCVPETRVHWLCVCAKEAGAMQPALGRKSKKGPLPLPVARPGCPFLNRKPRLIWELCMVKWAPGGVSWLAPDVLGLQAFCGRSSVSMHAPLWSHNLGHSGQRFEFVFFWMNYTAPEILLLKCSSVAVRNTGLLPETTPCSAHRQTATSIPELTWRSGAFPSSGE